VPFEEKRFEGGHRLDNDTLRALDLPAASPVLDVEDILSLPHPEPDARIQYGDDALQFGELRLPKGAGPHPLAIVLHGRCWRAVRRRPREASACPSPAGIIPGTQYRRWK
jgi:hypothetical protein